MHDYDHLSSRLETISEELAELAMASLRDGLGEDGDVDAAKAEERRLTKARRAVEKAANLLNPPVYEY
ncbi:MAG: hypothetical protein HKN26_07770 [Acidimicrobiales bacterium]|nr:hypothetical protein [Acidimicrobiales bacterium]